MWYSNCRGEWSGWKKDEKEIGTMARVSSIQFAREEIHWQVRQAALGPANNSFPHCFRNTISPPRPFKSPPPPPPQKTHTCCTKIENIYAEKSLTLFCLHTDIVGTFAVLKSDFFLFSICHSMTFIIISLRRTILVKSYIKIWWFGQSLKKDEM